MHEKTVLITGATSGIGFYTAKALGSKGAQVIITGRDGARGRKAADELRQRASNDQIHFIAVDHSTIGANFALGERITNEFDHLHVLINNVGGALQRRETSEGYDTTLALNFLGPFALTQRLLPCLEHNKPARIINVVSSAYTMWQRDPLEDLNGQEGFVAINAYAHVKLLNLLWTFALARRLEGSGIVINATNPGMAWTPGTQALTPETVPAWRFFWPLVRWIQRRASPEKASRSCVFLASSDEGANVSGKYFESHAKASRPSALALNIKNQERVWDLGMRLCTQVPAGE